MFGAIIILLAVFLTINKQTPTNKKVLGEKVVSGSSFANSVSVTTSAKEAATADKQENRNAENTEEKEEKVKAKNIQYPNIPISNIKNADTVENSGITKNLKEERDYFLVTKVVDGDTIDVMIGTTTERVRLIGINTPETVDPRKPVECFGREASAKAHELLENKKIYLETDETQDNRDKYGRLLRYARREDGLFYNLEIIKQGYAYEYTYQIPYKYQTEFKAAQVLARENKLGLWADNACAGSTVGAVTSDVAATSDVSNAAPNSNCNIKGNINSKGEKFYHLLNCGSYAKTVINIEQGERWFCAESEAQAAGWRRAQNCP